MDDDVQDIIAAFVDNECVDADALARALAQPDGREYLIDLLALREAVDRCVPAVALVPPLRSTGPRRRVLALAAAAMLAVGGVTGYTIASRATPAAPVVTTWPALQMPMTTPHADTQKVAPPAPTTVIRLERGVDWTEARGGI
jgi:hypothetical protein